MSDKPLDVSKHHTPGPWRIASLGDRYERLIFTLDDALGSHFGRITAPVNHARAPLEAEANARLVQEAPAMLEALIAVRCDQGGDTNLVIDEVLTRLGVEV